MLARSTALVSLVYENTNDPWAVAWYYTLGVIGSTWSMTAVIYRNSSAGTLTSSTAEWQLSTDNGETYSAVSADSNHVISYGTFGAVPHDTSRYKAETTLTIGGSSGIVVGDYGLYRVKATGTDAPAFTKTFPISDPA